MPAYSTTSRDHVQYQQGGADPNTMANHSNAGGAGGGSFQPHFLANHSTANSSAAGGAGGGQMFTMPQSSSSSSSLGSFVQQPTAPLSPPPSHEGGGAGSAFTGSDSEDGGGLGTNDNSEQGDEAAGGQGGSERKKQRRAGFIETLYTMANTAENESAIGFAADGVSLEVRNTADFSSRVLPKHFKHKNVSSFIRQLNNYGFRTIPSPKGVFQTFVHDNFLKDRRDLIKFISRRSGGEVKKKKTLYEQVVEFKQREQDRNRRMDELETRDLQRSMYVNELEHQNRALLDEREGLLMENQRLMMILSANGGGGGGPVQQQQYQHHQQHAAAHAHAQAMMNEPPQAKRQQHRSSAGHPQQQQYQQGPPPPPPPTTQQQQQQHPANGGWPMYDPNMQQQQGAGGLGLPPVLGDSMDWLNRLG